MRHIRCPKHLYSSNLDRSCDWIDNEVKTGDTIDTIGGRSFFKRQHLQITSHIPAGISQGFNGLLATNNASSYVYIKSEL